MLFKSIRWRIFAWYALVVTVSASSFYVIAYFNVSRSIDHEIDDQLEQHALELASVLTPDRNGKFVLELPPQQSRTFQQNGDRAPYYRIWNRERIEVDSSSPALVIPHPNSIGSRNRDGCREVSVDGPAGSVVLVGRSTYRKRQQLKQLATTGIFLGFGALVGTLAGGWLIANKALAPIDRISKAAAAISESNLSERIDGSRMEIELANLSQMINGAFDRLQRSLDRQTRFTADASHEMRTPLSIILAQAQLALKTPRSDCEYQEFMGVISRAATRMKRVVEGLLILARVDSKQLPLNLEQVDLDVVVRETCDLLMPMVEQQQLTLTTDLADIQIMGDRHRLGEATTNLLTNAINYNQPGGTIDVKLTKESGLAKLVVADTGQGIPESDQPHVFERFYQVDQERSFMAGRGSGLGLAITMWIAEAHGGTVVLESREGVGSKFVLTVKLDRPDSYCTKSQRE